MLECLTVTSSVNRQWPSYPFNQGDSKEHGVLNHWCFVLTNRMPPGIYIYITGGWFWAFYAPWIYSSTSNIAATPSVHATKIVWGHTWVFIFLAGDFELFLHRTGDTLHRRGNTEREYTPQRQISQPPHRFMPPKLFEAPMQISTGFAFWQRYCTTL